MSEQMNEQVIAYMDGTYRGELRDGLPHGLGALRWSDGSIILGDWIEGKVVGCYGYLDASDGRIMSNYSSPDWPPSCTQIYKDGQRVEGTIRDNDFVGRVLVSYVGGGSLVVDWAGGNLTGRGEQNLAQGVYEGDFVGGKRHGKGTFRFSDGRVYEGEWRDDLPQGTGTLTDREECITYEGSWEQGTASGRGVLRLSHERRAHVDYVGGWQGGLFHDEGKLEWSKDGRVEATYEGGFAQGKRTGRGAYYTADGFRYDGGWSDDKYNGDSEVTLPNRLNGVVIWMFGVVVPLFGTSAIPKRHRKWFTTDQIPKPRPTPQVRISVFQ